MVKETKSREDFRAIEFFFVRRMERRGGGGGVNDNRGRSKIRLGEGKTGLKATLFRRG